MSKKGVTCFVLSFHSPSLHPGCTPYVRTQDELSSFMRELYFTLKYLIDDIGAVPRTVSEIGDELSGS